MANERHPSKTWKELAQDRLKNAPPAHLRRARPGAVFTVADKAINLPETRVEGAPERSMHPGRRVIVAQMRERCPSSDPLTILVVPCSAHHRGDIGEWDFAIPDGEPGFTEEDVVAYTSLVQPILKTDLLRLEGNLRAPTLVQFQATLAQQLGITATPAPISIPARVGIKPDPTSGTDK